eukprot:g16841.t1
MALFWQDHLLVSVTSDFFVFRAGPAALFYFLQGFLLLLLWIAVYLGSGVDFLRLGEKLSNTALLPVSGKSFLGRNVFLPLLRPRFYRPAAYGVVPLMFVQALLVEPLKTSAPNPDPNLEASRGISVIVPLSRTVIAAAVTVFQFGDSARTSSHRDYLMLYNCWVLAACAWIAAVVSCADDEESHCFFLSLLEGPVWAFLPIPIQEEQFVFMDQIAQSCALGLCVWYIASSGVAKVVVAGFRAWAFGDTLHAILETFARKTPKQGGPVLGPVARWLAAGANHGARRNVQGTNEPGVRVQLQAPLLHGQRSGALSTVRKPNWWRRLFLNAAAFCTIFFEFVAAPVCLLVLLSAGAVSSLYARAVLGGGMVFLHLAIGALQSGAIGAFFLPCIASYVYGLTFDFAGGEHAASTSPAPTLTPTPLALLVLPVCVACLPLALPFGILACFRRKGEQPCATCSLPLLPERWPLTPMALFPWNRGQWKKLHDLLVSGDTRLVALASASEDDLGDDGSSEGTSVEQRTATAVERMRRLQRSHLLGVRVIPIEHDAEVHLMDRVVAPLPNEGAVAYDLWSRVIGITTFQHTCCDPNSTRPPTILEAAARMTWSSDHGGEEPQPVDCAREDQAGDRGSPVLEEQDLAARQLGCEPQAQALLDAVGAFLRREERVVEVSTRKILTTCALVRVEKSDSHTLRVQEVLAVPGQDA